MSGPAAGETTVTSKRGEPVNLAQLWGRENRLCGAPGLGAVGSTPRQSSRSGCGRSWGKLPLRGYVTVTVLDDAGVAAWSRGIDGFIGRRPKRRTVSTHAERSRPSRSRIGANVKGMRPRLPFTI